MRLDLKTSSHQEQNFEESERIKKTEKSNFQTPQIGAHGAPTELARGDSEAELNSVMAQVAGLACRLEADTLAPLRRAHLKQQQQEQDL